MILPQFGRRGFTRIVARLVRALYSRRPYVCAVVCSRSRCRQIPLGGALSRE